MDHQSTIKPCIKCGAPRASSSHYCRPCANAKDRLWRKNNPEKVKELNRRKRDNGDHTRWIERHRDQRNAIQRAYYAKTAEKRRAEHMGYYRRNLSDPVWREKEWRRLNDLGHQRRAGGGPPSQETLDYIELISNDLCVYCGKPAGTIDHIVPIANGGQHNWENLAPACRSCNAKKNAVSLMHFLLKQMKA